MIANTFAKLWKFQSFRYATVAVTAALISIIITVIAYPTQSVREEAVKETTYKLEEHFKSKTIKMEEHFTESNKQILETHSAELSKKRDEYNEIKQKNTELIKENTSLKSKRRVETIVTKDPSGKEETHIVDVSESETSSSKETNKITELEEKHRKEILEIEQGSVLKITSEKAKQERRIAELNEQLSKSKQEIEVKEKKLSITESNSKRIGLGLGYTTKEEYSAELSYQFWGSLYGQISGDSDLKKHKGRLTLGLRF